jgi:MFS family permease
MWAAVCDEWRTVRRIPAVWLIPLAVAGLAFALLPLNAGMAEFMNPEDRLTAQQMVDTFRADGLNLYTSGFGWGQFLSMLFGMSLVLRDYRRASPRVPVRPAPDPARAMPAKLLVAVVAGIVLALADLAVTLPAATPRAQRLWDDYGFGYVADPDLLHDPAVRTAVILGVVGFPLWGALGVGLAALAGRWTTLMRFLGVSIVATCLFYGTARLGHTVWATLGVALLPLPMLPPSTVLSIAATVNSPYSVPVAISGTVGATLYTALFYYAGRAALHRRLTHGRHPTDAGLNAAE